MRKGLPVLAALAVLLAPAGAGAQDDARYAMANGCFVMKPKSGGYVAKSGTGYRSNGGAPASGEPLFMKATELGRYLLYTRGRDYLGSANGKAATEAQPGESADWSVEGAAGSFKVLAGGRALGLAGDELVLVDPAQAELFAFEPAQGCATFPEIDTGTSGTPAQGEVPYGEVRGYADAHEHLMAFEFLGGSVHCGRPWHRYGVEFALRGCADPQDTQYGTTTETAYTGREPSADRSGWPRFPDWPAHDAITQEYAYYKWIERGWLGGVRLVVNLMVENEALCKVYPTKKYPSCDEAASVRRQMDDIYALENYIDAQSGGPGKGFFRIVRDPFEARRVINQGKLAVVLGIETSAPFNCKLLDEVPQCTKADIDQQLDTLHRQGIRGMEVINKFDNAFGGVAGDAGSAGVLVNTGNKVVTNRYWDLQTCTEGSGEDTDKPQQTPPGSGRDGYGAALGLFLPGGSAPVYPPGPHCNVKGLSALGDHLVRRLMEKQMMIDPDHLSVLARRQLLNLTESKDYKGVLSSHSWSTPEGYKRISDVGGLIASAGGGLDLKAITGRGQDAYIQSWRYARQNFRNTKYLWGFGFGADQNGFAQQPPPRADAAKDPLPYPYKSFDGAVTLDRQKSGERTFDLNKDGVAHYGMLPDWIADMTRRTGGEMQNDMARSAEHYLQTWERAVGVIEPRCRSARGKFRASGLFNVSLRAGAESVLRQSGQPATRQGRVWTWCVEGKRNQGRKVSVAYTPEGTSALVASDAQGHRAGRVERGHRVTRKLRARTKRFGKGVLITRRGKNTRTVYLVRRGRVRGLAVASREAFRTKKTLAGYLKLAGLR
ncbi:MAG: hypothetical protein H0V29_02260 [Thermoleophilaceae bacterium]|nr:hypothetical protein [Thermoleophilaceae bacterium]